MKQKRKAIKLQNRARTSQAETIDSLVTGSIYGDWNFYSEKCIVKAYLSAIIRAVRGACKRHNAMALLEGMRSWMAPGDRSKKKKKKTSCRRRNCPIVPNRFSTLRRVLERSSTTGPVAGAVVVAARTAFARIQEEFQLTCETSDKRRDLHSLTSRSAPTAAASGSSCRRRCIRQLVFDRNKRRKSAASESEAKVMPDTAIFLEAAVLLRLFDGPLHYLKLEPSIRQSKEHRFFDQQFFDRSVHSFSE